MTAFDIMKGPNRKQFKTLAHRGAPKNPLNRKKVLVDAQNEKDLETKFTPFTNNMGFLANVGALGAFIRASFTDEGMNAMDGSIPAGKDKPQMAYLETAKGYATIIGGPSIYMNIHENKVTNILAPLNLTVTLRTGELQIEFLQDKLNSLFGKGALKLPETITKKPLTQDLAIEVASTGYQPLDYFTKLNMDNKVSSSIYVPEKFKLISNMQTSVRNAVLVDVKLLGIKLSYASEGRRLDASNVITLTFQLDTKVIYPLQFALWLTHATSLSDFIPKLFKDKMSELMITALKNKSGDYDTKAKFIRTMHLGIVKKLNQERQKDYGEPSPRVNADGFCVLRDGDVYYIPDVDNTDKYVDLLRSAYDPTTGKTASLKTLPGLRNMPLYTDWMNDAIGYTNSEGRANNVNLQGAVPLDDVTIGQDLKQITVSDLCSDEAAGIKGLFKNVGSEVCARADLIDSSIVSSNPELFEALSFSGLCQYLTIMFRDEPLFQVLNGTSVNTDKDRALVAEFKRLCLGVFNNMMNDTKTAFSTLIAVRYYFALIGKYAPDYESKYAPLISNNIEKNKPISRAEAKTSFALPNMPGIKNVLPHQAPMLTMAERGPTSEVVEAGAGAGKTVMLAADLMIQVYNKRFKRAAVACPTKLVKEYCTELNNYSKGHINALPLTIDTVKESLIKVRGFSKKDLIAYLKGAPPNTIFVIGFSLLGSRTDYFDGVTVPALQFGEEAIQFFPMAQLLRQVGIDIMAVDESHFLKNENAGRTKAIKFITPTVSSIRIGSGTMDKDNPADSASQFGLINPAIYKDKADFIKKYGQSEGGAKFLKWKDGQRTIQKYMAASAPYTARYRASKIDWSQLLPRINIQLVNARLTPNQQVFYDNLLRDAIAKITADKEINKLIEQGDESDKAQSKIEKALKSNLNTVERFIFAPDDNPGFRAFLDENGLHATPQDFISCDVAKIDNIIESRFKGVDPNTGAPVVGGPSKNKIIVAFINKSASRHALKHSKYRNVAVHYASDPKSLLDFDSKGNPVPASGKTGLDMLDKFRTDDKKRVLFADIGSIREGFNLQLADTFIRVQTPWSPGEIEQEQARVLRPDVYNRYGREAVYVYWLQVRHTHVIAKTARLVSKMVMIHQKNEDNNPSWIDYQKTHPMPQDLKHISMNMDFLTNILGASIISSQIVKPNDPSFIKRMQSNDDLIALEDHFKAYQVMSGWEDHEFDENIKRLAQEVADRTGQKYEDVSPYATDDPAEAKRRALALRLSSMLPNDGSTRIEGSKSYYVPIQPGSIPVDPRDVNIIPIARAKAAVKKTEGDDDEDGLDFGDEEDEKEEDTKDVEDNVKYDVGDVVYTEYGVGEISQIRAPRANGSEAKVIKVLIPGLKRHGFTDDNLWLPKITVFMPKEPPIAIGEDGKPTPEALEENSAWKARVKSFHKEYNNAKLSGQGITFISDGVNPEPPVIIEDKKPVIPPKKPKLPDIDVKHPAADEPNDNIDTNPVQKYDPKLLKELQKLPENKMRNADSIPSAPKKPKPKDTLSVDVDVINGMLALQFYSEDPEFKALMKYDNSIRVLPPYYDVHIKTAKGAKAFIDLMDEHFIMPSSYTKEGQKVLGTKDKLLMIAKRMGGRLRSSTPLSVSASGGSHVPLARGISNFYRINHSAPKINEGAKPGIKLYPALWNDGLYICIPRSNQPRQAKMFLQLFRKNKTEIGVPKDVGNVSSVEGTAVKLFDKQSAALKYIDGLANHFKIEDQADLYAQIKDKAIRRMMRMPPV